MRKINDEDFTSFIKEYMSDLILRSETWAHSRQNTNLEINVQLSQIYIPRNKLREALIGG